MPETIVLTLPQKVKHELESASKEAGVSASDLIGKAYLFFHRLHFLRDRLIPQAEAQGIYSDEDLFAQLS
jgi:hypothetical protein